MFEMQPNLFSISFHLLLFTSSALIKCAHFTSNFSILWFFYTFIPKRHINPGKYRRLVTTSSSKYFFEWLKSTFRVYCFLWEIRLFWFESSLSFGVMFLQQPFQVKVMPCFCLLFEQKTRHTLLCFFKDQEKHNKSNLFDFYF